MYLPEIKQNVRFKLDSGAEINVIPEYIFKGWDLNKKLKPCKIKATNHSGSSIKVLGEIKLEVEHKNKTKELEFIIVETNPHGKCILGIETINDLQLAKVIGIINKKQRDIVKEFEDVFKGIGKIKTKPCDFKLKDNYETVIAHCRKIPFNIMDEYNKELSKMIEDGIIKEQTEPTEFVNPTVVVRKPNGRVRICLDPKILNKGLMREHMELPTFDEVMNGVAGNEWFSVLDANKGFYQLELTDKASMLTTFATPKSRFRFTRLPFGLSVAPEMYQKKFSEIFADIKGVKTCIDDIIVYAKNKEEHDQILLKLLERARKHGVKFNKEKCQSYKNEVKYMGHLISGDGIKMDPNRIEAIKCIKPPKNTKELSRFMGMINFVARFVPNMTKRTVNMRQMMKKEVIWVWGKEQDLEFQDLKNALTQSPVSRHFNDEVPIVLSVDSSKDGMGAVILQNDAPVAYASKSLNET